MDFVNFKRLIDPIRKKLYRLVGKAILAAIDNSEGMQKVQITLLKNETVTDIERVQEYGIDTYPKTGAQAIIFCINGNRDHGIVLNISDVRHRPTDLAEGEVALYTAEDQNSGGHRIHLKSGQEVEINCANVDINCTGDADIDCATANITASSGINLNGGGALMGVVTGASVCHYTGSPHGSVSTNVKASS